MNLHSVLREIVGQNSVGVAAKMSDEQPSFKVTDRRLFNPDGTPREVPEDERPETKPEPPPAANNERAGTEAESPAPAVEAAGGQAPAAASVQEAPQAAAGSEAHDAEPDLDAELPGAKDPASFANFLMSIASNAASSLGMMEHPVTGKREVDLELGKHWIDVLGMLEQKTRNNLLPQEAQILEGLLADLRMQFVSLTNATPKARTYSSRDITGG
jgi:hypothetical protein